MTTERIRSTLSIESELHRALRMKAASSRRSMSDIVNEAVRLVLREDQEDLAAVTERANEPPIAYEEFLDQLRADRTL